jgi:tetratricopeptide (TPR) repeat protein
MTLRMRRIRQFWWLMAFILLLIASAGLVWGRYRLSADPKAELNSAYRRGDWKQTAALARERLKKAPDDASALRLAARAAARQDQAQKAVAIYHQLEQVAAGRKEAEDFFLLGRALSRLGQFDRAVEAYEVARSRDPDLAEALAVLAALYLRTDRNDAAEATARRLARQPQWEAKAQLLLGTALLAGNDPAGAARALETWACLDPEGLVVAPEPAGSFRKLLARSWLQSGRPGEARKVLETLLGAGPDPEASWLLSRCFIQEKDWKQAAELLKQLPHYRSDHPLEPEPAGFVGEARCALCHRRECDAVLSSRHATTFARAKDLGNLELPRGPLRDPGNPEVTHQLRLDGNSLVVETRVDQKVLRAIVDYAFGSPDHFTTFVGRDDHGRPRMVRMSSYRCRGEKGWDLATGLPPRPVDLEEYLGKKMLEGDGVRRCLNCHTTNPRAILREAGPEAADSSIGCEKCHSPAGHHVAAVAAGFSDLAIDSPGEASPAEIDQICAKCHGNQQPERLGRPQTDPIWVRFQSLSLSWSRCYTESGGSLGCVTCHDPHRNIETKAATYEAACLSCHAAESSKRKAGSLSPRPPGRSRESGRERRDSKKTRTSCPVNPASGCVDCHLPRIWVESTHSFKADHYIRIRDLAPSEVSPAGASGRAGHE